MPVHTNSRTLTIRATKAPWLALSPRPAADIRKPPYLPPSCKGMKKRRLAKSEVKARMRMQSA